MTLIELGIASTIGTLVLASVMPLFMVTNEALADSKLKMQTDRKASLSVEQMIFGMPGETGLRGCSRADVTTNESGWVIDFSNVDGDQMSFTYNVAQSNIVFDPGEQIVTDNVVSSSVQVAGRTITLSVSVQGTFRGRTNVCTSATSAAFRNQW